jgi:hypothetical protein
MRMSIAVLSTLRPGIRWTLGASLLASMLALLPAAEPAAPLMPKSYEKDVRQQGGREWIALPERLPALSLERAEHDPFESPTLLPPVVPVATPAPPPSFLTASNSSALGYRYLGQLLDLQGRRMVYIVRGDNKEILVSPGMRLDDGFLVEAIAASELTLFHEPSQQRTSILIPVSNPS